MDFMEAGAEGSAGGMLCLWNPDIFALQECCSNRNFVLLPGGDFNEVKVMSERKGCLRRDRGIKDFNELIENLELIDIPMIGRIFTWCNALDGDRWSRIDRFLLDHKWLEKFSFKQLGLPRSISYHCPVLLMEDERDWGPRPFKFINAWRLHPNFKSEVRKSWNNSQVSGWASYRFMKKLGNLRAHLKRWNSEVFGNIDEQLKQAEAEHHDWDIKAEGRNLLEHEVKRRREVRKLVYDLNKKKECLWHQKSRLTWPTNGDKNTRFFHILASSRQRKNLLDSVKENGVIYDQPDVMKQAVVRYFSQLFSEEWKIRPKLSGVFVSIGPKASELLEVEFSEEEIWEAVNDCDSNKASGPDGFNLSCIQKCWKIMKKEIVLSRRLRKVLPKIISEVQSAFFSGRCILDGVLIANEVVDWWKRSKKQGIILKLDFEKAYDSVNWEFLYSMLTNFGFGEKWVRWMKTCISTARVSVLVNGSPTTEFSPMKGLRQGDPLSPFLFNIVAEGLNLLMSRAKEVGLIKGASIGPNDLRLSHLQFADDTIIFCEADVGEIIAIKRILRCFEVLSGLKINFHKNQVCGIGVQDDLVKVFANRLHCHSQKLPLKYLGLPLEANPRRKSTWQPVVDNFKVFVFCR
ncbi:uncharacterized protein LOC114271593 [Camellia sinensis]|uniref:uncharacterized protein LOC114271593 n=1 Tax=Camellia sinensis TaxID=4442 RepID=UPI0010358358|nr:uncharacterized protein LOC114271593 [Camellia sinensis]